MEHFGKEKSLIIASKKRRKVSAETNTEVYAYGSIISKKKKKKKIITLQLTTRVGLRD